MNANTQYKPYWPETVIFWGAGATQGLGMLMTKQIGNVFHTLSGLSNSKTNQVDIATIQEALPDATNKIIDELKDFLTIIDLRQSDTKREQARNNLGFNVKRAERLARLYDWNAVIQVIERCPGINAGSLALQDLYNLLDMHIKSQNGIEVDGEFITLDRLISARRTVDMLTQLFHTISYQKMIKDDTSKHIYRQYYGFAKLLADRMKREGLERARKGNLDSRDFYLFSYAVISMNWDPILLWLIFNAHREANDSAFRPNIGMPPQPMKLFNDLAHFMAVRKVNGGTPGAWFPMNETAVQRLNDPDHHTDRRVRIGKFYFPHGCHGFRQCPKCGKLTFYLGNDWTFDSDSLFPPQIIPSLSPKKARSTEEEKAIKGGVYDAVQCTHCGQITEAHHTPLVMQTNFKGGNPSFIEEIQSDMKVALEKAKHIIFAGYSLPTDDFIYRSILAARHNMKGAVKCSVIGYSEGAKDKWLYAKDMQLKKKQDNSAFIQTCQRVADIFGVENVRGYAQGIPNVFLKNGQADKGKVEEMLRNW
ncbi:hypothetical protein [Sporolactobacillus inulinus]|nr:hypothetical protein [Sporolactobacillus inulinus]GEB78093.1 hypothetical protein SIN01_24380 [Sporolactobacillus inulinus]